MLPEGGLDWIEVPSAMDGLFFPEMTSSYDGASLAVFVRGTRKPEGGEEQFLVLFNSVEAFSALGDRYYLASGGDGGRASVLTEAIDSAALRKIGALRGEGEPLHHYSLIGGGMQYDILSAYPPDVGRVGQVKYADWTPLEVVQ